MTSPDDPTTTTAAEQGWGGEHSLPWLLGRWQDWNGREVFDRAARTAAEAGDETHAAVLRDAATAGPAVGAVEALAAQHRVSALLAGWEWHTVRAAREEGATWSQIAAATDTTPEQARTGFLDAIARHENAAFRGWVPEFDIAGYETAAGTWHDELHPDTPDTVREEIEQAISADDVDEQEVLRARWWNPEHPPAVARPPGLAVAHGHDDGAELDVRASSRALIDKTVVDAVREATAQDWADLVDQVESERAVGVTEYTVEQAAQRLTALAGTGEHAREQVEAWRTGLEGPAVLEPGELYAIATRMTGQDGHDPVGRLNAARVTGALVSPARHAENPAARAALIEEAATFARYVREAQDPAEDAEIARTRLLDEAGSVDESGASDAVVHTFDPADAYTAAEIGALAAAHARGDDAEVARVEAGRPSVVPDRAATAGEPVEAEMPEWMREQARRTEAEIAAGTHVPGPPDDRDRIAARLAELRAAAEAATSAAGDEVDPGAPGQDDPAWWAPTEPAERALTHHEVAAELTGRGFTPEQARAAITDYLDDTSDRIGISVHQWAMDSHDIAAIAHTHRPPVPVPEQRHPGTAEQTATANQRPTRGDAPPDYADERDDWEQVRGGDPRSYEQMMGDAAGALTTHHPDRSTDGERREQLVRWHTDDTTGGPDRGDDGHDDVVGSDWDDEPMIFEGRW